MSSEAMRAAPDPRTASAAPVWPLGILSYRDALRHVMREALRVHPHVMVFGQGVDDHKGTFGSTRGLSEEFGADRVFDTPLAEEGMTGIAVGAALHGAYPIHVHIRADFVLLAINQIVNLAAKYRYMFGGRFEVPMLIRTVVGRSWGQGAQHSQSPQSLFAHVPGLTVIMPSCSQTVLESYAHAISNHRGPVLSIEHRLLYNLDFVVTEPASDRPGPLSSRRARAGGDVTVVATSIMVLEALRAADWLARMASLSCEVIDLHCVSHPNRDMVLDSVRKTGRLLVADTSWKAYGVCAEVARWVAESDPRMLKAPVVSLGMQPAPCPTAKALEDLYYPSLHDFVDELATLVTGQRRHGIALPDERSMADVYKTFKGPF